jgi:hypothetical protein
MSEEEFAGNLGSGSTSSGGIRDFEVQTNPVSGAAGRGGGEYLDDRGPYGGKKAKGPDTLDRKLRQVQNVFRDSQGKADTQAYMDFMDNYRNAPFTKAGNALGELLTKGPSMSLARSIFGGSATPSAIDRSNALMQSIFNYAGSNPGMVKLKDEGLGMTIDTGTGTLNLRDSGRVTYSGRANPNYTGPFQDLVNPKSQSSEDGNDTSNMSQPFDPCPDGFKYNAETQQCEPVDDTEDTPTVGSKFVRNPVGLSTAFPDLTRYGREGGEYQFFTEMPGVNMKEGGIARGPQGEVTGPGGPKDDLVGPFMLSSQEYVLPYEMVLQEGGGSYDRGIKSLEKERMAALKKYKDRVASS